MKRVTFRTMLKLLLIGMLMLTFNIHVAKSGPRTWTVDDDGPADFDTVQGAIGTANSGDTIYVYNGTYFEQVIISKRLVIVGENQNTTIIDGGGTGTVIRIQASYVNVSCFTIRNSSQANWTYAGIFLYGYSERCTIQENKIEYCGSSIIIGDSHRNNIIRNILANFTFAGVILYRSLYNVIDRNYITSNITWHTKWPQLGIHLDYSSDNNTVARNIIVSTQCGIELEHSSRNEFRNNTILDNKYGVLFYNYRIGTSAGGGNKLRFNNLTSNYYSLGIFGISLNQCIQDIDASNVIDGKPVFYLVNRHNLEVPPSTFPNLGYLGLVNCTYINVRNLTIANNVCGILLAYTSHSTISNVLLSKNGYGMQLVNAFNNTICSSTIRNNDYGMGFCNSKNNLIFHNNFTDNTYSVYDSSWVLPWVSPSINVWNIGYPLGGNYWSHYITLDEKCGPEQNQLGNDGISDIPYQIDEYNEDRYPLINPWLITMPRGFGDLSGDGIVDLYDVVLAATAYGSKPGDPNWNPFADLAPPWRLINIYDIVTVAYYYGKTYP